ncbi:MAG TPA: glycosyltransferase family 2 protein [Candidatus Nanopelagicales bacterium]
MTASDLAVVVVSFESSELLRSNLARTASELSGSIVVVVDNSVTAGERDRTRRLCAERDWVWVASSTNTGFGRGMNSGVAAARERGAAWLLLLNPDALITGPDVLALLEAARLAPLTLVAPRILRPDGSLWSEGSDLYLEDGRIRSVRRRDGAATGRLQTWVSGACLLLGTELWDLVGGFATDYFLYWEDVELSFRVERAGGAILVHETAVAVHAEGGTQGTGHTSAGARKSGTYYYYNIRNRLLFSARNLPDEDVRAWMGTARSVAYEILLQGGRRQFLLPWTPVSAALRGTRDGLRIARAELADRDVKRRPGDARG